MRQLFLLSAVTLLATIAPAQEASFYLRDGDKVLFYGDSITDQRNYTMAIETYILTRYPKLQLQFTNSGWGGDRVTGGGGGDIDLRLKRDVTAYKPTVVTIMLGMNDGGYKAATEASDKTFFDGFRHINEVLKQDDPQARITAILPSPYDDVTRPSARPVTGGAAYNQVLIAYGKWIGVYGKENHLTVADANTDFVHMIERANQLDPIVAKEILPDHIHPTFGGALMIAEAVLKSWNARALVSSVAINVANAKPKLIHSEDAVVTGLASGPSLSWTETDDALPLPFPQWQDMWGAGPTVPLVIRSSDITAALNQQPLRITGLHDGVYSLRIDGTSIGTFTNDQFAEGINLALYKTPMTEQAMSVYQLTDQHGDIHYDRWRHVQVPFATVSTAPAAITAMDALETSLVEKQREAATPKPHNFEVAIIP